MLYRHQEIAIQRAFVYFCTANDERWWMMNESFMQQSIIRIRRKRVCKSIGIRICLTLSDSDNIRIRTPNTSLVIVHLSSSNAPVVHCADLSLLSKQHLVWFILFYITHQCAPQRIHKQSHTEHWTCSIWSNRLMHVTRPDKNWKQCSSSLCMKLTNVFLKTPVTQQVWCLVRQIVSRMQYMALRHLSRHYVSWISCFQAAAQGATTQLALPSPHVQSSSLMLYATVS